MKPTITFALSTLASVSLVSCSATRSRNKDFLSSYEGFEQQSQFSDAMTYHGDLSRIGDYDHVFVEEVKVYPPENMEKDKITGEDLAKLEDEFREALRDEIGESRLSITSSVGPRTLSLRAGVTDVQPGNPALFAAGYAPYLGVATTAARAVTGHKMGAGTATVEAEILDSRTRERFFGIIDENAGSKLQVIEGLNRWGHVKVAFREWSETFRKMIRESAESDPEQPSAKPDGDRSGRLATKL